MATSQTTQQRTFLGHPLGLYVLFFTEMWERFSYYGMRALLLLYMVNYFKWSQKDASSVYKWYTSLVYVTPILGGYLADRFLGNRLAVIIGAVLMAIGHFLMAFEEYSIFYLALVALIIGNGFFKPNMSTQVGRLYPTNDPRRDGAYTIFYMGINLGAFLAPLACGWLQENTVGGYHSGFTLAGAGMLIGLVTYLLGQKALVEVDPALVYQGETEKGKKTEGLKPLTEEQAAVAPSVLGPLSGLAIGLLYAAGAALVALAGYQAYAAGGVTLRTLPKFVPVLLSAGTMFICAWIMSQVKNGLRDRVFSIVILGIFVVFFWAAFEQAGNALNVWADKHTNRFLTKTPLPVSVYPEVAESAKPVENGEQVGRPTDLASRFKTMFQLKKSASDGAGGTDTLNPVPTTWFQSINALAIFVIAPFFAWMWTRVQLSIPMKMALGLFLQAVSFLFMIQAAKMEDRSATVKANFAGLPAPLYLNDQKQICEKVAAEGEKGVSEYHPYNAGRLKFDGGNLTLTGVLADNERDLIARATAPASYQKVLKDLQEKLKKQVDEKAKVEATAVIPEDVKGFDLRYAGMAKGDVAYDEATRTLTVRTPLADKDIKSLQVCGGNPEFRAALDQLMVKSGDFRVSPWWLFWCYLFATLAELCLSPVGLSMVSKLAPAKFATMLMGLWLLTSAFGNFAAGALGELWGTIAPVPYFTYSTLSLVIAGTVLLASTWLVNRLMHGIR